MLKQLVPLTLILSAALVNAHPMGNFSVSHYTRFDVKASSVDVLYVLDLAELPTFDLLRQWGVERTAPRGEMDRKAAAQARDWMQHLQISSDGQAVTPKFVSADFAIADGAGNLPIVRIASHLRLDVVPGKLEYEDRNFPDRAGWKEIVIQPSSGVNLARASQAAQDRSKALTEYPQDPTVAPPQDVRASFEWTALQPVVVAEKSKPVPAPSPVPDPVVVSIPQPKAPPAQPPSTMTPKGAPAGSVVKGDFLSRLLHQRELTLGMILIALAAAFGLGAAHALTPGHGKTIVAAYLVGSRGTLKHAAFLGAMVTFTHTVSVFLLGLATLFLFQYVMPEKITQALGVVSGLSIVAVGGWMLYKRLAAVRQGHSHHDHVHPHEHPHEHHHDHVHPHVHAPVLAAAHHHDHPHDHPHTHVHDHEPAVAVAHTHSHGDHHHDHPHTHVHDHEPAVAVAHTHSQGDHHHDHGHSHAPGKLVHSHGPGGHVHSHDVPDEISWGSLTALAVSGGLVPCESALVLLLSAIALGRVGLGLMLLVAFSLGLALVLVIIGMLVIYAKDLFPKRDASKRHPFFQWVPILSAAVVVIVGLLMTSVSLGWLQPKWMI